jgi:hypothetical protein
MARFPAYEKNALELGRLLARAAVDKDFQQMLMANPEAELRRIGLPEETVALFKFKIVPPDNSQPAPVVLPYRLNEKRLASMDPDYLASIARSIPHSALN